MKSNGYDVVTRPVSLWRAFMLAFVALTAAAQALAVSVTMNTPNTTQNVIAGTTLTVSATAVDAGGGLREHWLEVKRPQGDWSWEGWLTDYPWEGSLNGDEYSSEKSGSFTFTTSGVYVVRSTVLDSTGNWTISSEIVVNVSPAVSATISAPSSAVSLTVGDSLTISGSASSTNGNLSQHWLEIRRPQGDWSWEGWLTSYPFEGSLNGTTSYSDKTGSFQFNDAGNYIVRCTAMDSFGNWVISAEITVTVATGGTAPVVSLVATGSFPAAGGKWVSLISVASDADGDLATHFIGFTSSSPITSTTPTGSSSSTKNYTTFVPTGGASTLFATATDSGGRTTSTTILVW